jgi:hypothetical protein
MKIVGMFLLCVGAFIATAQTHQQIKQPIIESRGGQFVDLIQQGGSISSIEPNRTLSSSDFVGWGAALVRADGAGNFYVGGTCVDSVNGQTIVVIKYTSSGERKWVKRYFESEAYADYIEGMVLDEDGNVYVTGMSGFWKSGGGLISDFLTIKYSSSGEELWSRRYSGGVSQNDMAAAITVDQSGNVYVTGGSSDINFNNYVCVTVKYDHDGNEQWVAQQTRGYGGTSGYAMTTDDTGNIYIAGFSNNSYSSNPGDYMTLKYNSSGTLQWASYYNGTGNGQDAGLAIQRDNDGNVYVTGRSDGSGSTDYATVKYNSSGVQQWVKRYASSSSSFNDASDLRVDRSENVYVTGSGASGCNGTTIKYNANGEQQWFHTDTQFNLITGMELDHDGNVYITGFGEDYITVKYNSSGSQVWKVCYNFADEHATSLTIDRSGNVCVTGYSGADLGSNNMFYYTGTYLATVKYDSNGNQQWADRIDGSTAALVTVEDKLAEPRAMRLYPNYPNPFNPATTIAFYLANPSTVTLQIENILGQEVEVLLDNVLMRDGEHSIAFTANNLPSGVYFSKLNARSSHTPQIQEIKRMVLLK